jgi:TfoX/Sxy family transcriptional regulator of competence genes
VGHDRNHTTRLRRAPAPLKLGFMSYDTELADRVRIELAGRPGITELKMFGGWGVTIHGNMAVGVMNRDLIVRVGPDAYEKAVALTGARPFDFTGRSMPGWVYVDGASVRTRRALGRWVQRGVDFTINLPPKAATKPRRSPAA